MSPNPQSTAHPPHHPHPRRSCGGFSSWSTLLLHLSEGQETWGSCKSRAVSWRRRAGSWGGVKHKPCPRWWGAWSSRGWSQQAELGAGSRVHPQPRTRWGYEAGSRPSPEQQETLAETGLETRLQPRSRTQPGDRRKARTGCPGLSRGCWFLVGLIRATKAYRGHQDPDNWCRIGAQDLWQLLLQDGESEIWIHVALRALVALRVCLWGSAPFPANPIKQSSQSPKIPSTGTPDIIPG